MNVRSVVGDALASCNVFDRGEPTLDRRKSCLKARVAGAPDLLRKRFPNERGERFITGRKHGLVVQILADSERECPHDVDDESAHILRHRGLPGSSGGKLRSIAQIRRAASAVASAHARATPRKPHKTSCQKADNHEVTGGKSPQGAENTFAVVLQLPAIKRQQDHNTVTSRNTKLGQR